MNNLDQSQYNKIMDDYHKNLNAIHKKIGDNNDKLLNDIKEENGEAFYNDIIDLISDIECDSYLATEFSFVEKPTGKIQDEFYESFKFSWVDQWNTGIENDSFSGYVYVQINKNKFLRIPFDY